MYSVEEVKKALLFLSEEILPGEEEKLDKEITFLVNNANESGETIRHYIGYEISGLVHLGTGMISAIKIKALQDAGIRPTIWFANYHTWLNGKLDGKMETIKTVKDTYFKPMFIKCCETVGCNIDNIDFYDADVLYDAEKYKVNGYSFWDFMMMTSKQLTLSRVQKSISVTGKKEGEAVQFGTLCYPVMQVADAFFMQSHIVHAGMDQRKCHVLMREVAYNMGDTFGLKINNKLMKPIAVHHKLLLSLGIDAKSVSKKMNFETVDIDDSDLKMSKSKPDSAIWVHDNEVEIRRKLKSAYCPLPDKNLSIEENTKLQKYNPILNWIDQLVFSLKDRFTISRPEKFGGSISFNSYSQLFDEYLTGSIHPLDLKQALGDVLVEILQPIISYGEENKHAIELVQTLRK